MAMEETVAATIETAMEETVAAEEMAVATIAESEHQVLRGGTRTVVVVTWSWALGAVVAGCWVAAKGD
jgi:hypothetical protein